jgi:hypothetical protein
MWKGNKVFVFDLESLPGYKNVGVWIRTTGVPFKMEEKTIESIIFLSYRSRAQLVTHPA